MSLSLRDEILAFHQTYGFCAQKRGVILAQNPDDLRMNWGVASKQSALRDKLASYVLAVYEEQKFPLSVFRGVDRDSGRIAAVLNRRLDIAAWRGSPIVLVDIATITGNALYSTARNFNSQNREVSGLVCLLDNSTKRDGTHWLSSVAEEVGVPYVVGITGHDVLRAYRECL